MTKYICRAFWCVFVTFSLEIVLPNEQVSDGTICQVMSILNLPGDNWYLAINGTVARQYSIYG